MKTIIHFKNYEDFQNLPYKILCMAHLITYDIECMDGEYESRVMVFKNRDGNQGFDISKAQLSVLQDCVVNGKPQPDFMLPNLQNCHSEGDCRLKDFNKRLNTLESEIYKTLAEVMNMSHDTHYDRLRRLEKELGVDYIYPSIEDRLTRIETNWSCRKILANSKPVAWEG